MEKYDIILNTLQGVLTESQYETKIVKEEGMDILKAELNGLGENKGHALMEILIAPTSDPEAEWVLQVYTTVAQNMDEENILPALVELNNINLACAIGAFHVYRQQRQMYHKYCVILRNEDALEAGIIQACTAVMASINTIDNNFDETLIISDDASKIERFRELSK